MRGRHFVELAGALDSGVLHGGLEEFGAALGDVEDDASAEARVEPEHIEASDCPEEVRADRATEQRQREERARPAEIPVQRFEISRAANDHHPDAHHGHTYGEVAEADEILSEFVVVHGTVPIYSRDFIVIATPASGIATCFAEETNQLTMAILECSRQSTDRGLAKYVAQGTGTASGACPTVVRILFLVELQQVVDRHVELVDIVIAAAARAVAAAVSDRASIAAELDLLDLVPQVGVEGLRTLFEVLLRARSELRLQCSEALEAGLVDFHGDLHHVSVVDEQLPRTAG